MKKDKSLVVFSGMLFLLCLFSAPQARIKWEKSTDTFSVEMTKDHFDSAVTRWRAKVNARPLSCTAPECDTLPPLYLTGMLRTGLFTKAVSTDSSHLKVYLTHLWTGDSRKFALYRIPNVTYTLKQELGLPADEGLKINEKSYWAFFGLTLLNSGAGWAYAHYKSPYSPEKAYYIISNGVLDALLTAGLFASNDKIRSLSLFCLPAVKIGVGFSVISIRGHNKYSRTGYKFILER
jgi:hypothetical protein